MKRVICILLSFLMSIPTINIVFAKDNSISRNSMEDYIKLLTSDSKVGIKYAPFAEYNDFIIQQLNSVDYDEYTANFKLDKLGWDAIWKNTQEMFGIKAYTQETYELIFKDILTKLAEIEKSDEERVQKETEKILKLLKTYDNVESLLKELDSNDVQIKAYTALKNNEDDLFRILSGIDIKKDSISGEYSILNDILKIYSVAIRDYSSASKYLDITKEVIYVIAEQESDKQVATAMCNAIDKVHMEYHDNFSATISEIGEQINSRIKSEVIKQAKAVLTLKLTDIGLDVVASKLFTAADIALYIKDLALNSDGTHQEVEAISKLSLSLGLTHTLQSKFINDGKKSLADNLLSVDEYEYMNKLFDFCKALQSLNYVYVDNLNVDGFWYNVHIAAGLSNDKYGFIAEVLDNDYIIERYLSRNKQDELKNIIDGGQCGETLYWEMAEDGELTIFGSGDMYHSEYSDDIVIKAGFPIGKKHWDNTKVTHVSFEGNVTSIGNHAFGGTTTENMDGSVTDTRCRNLKTITLPDTITTIGSYAFCECFNLEEIHFSNKLKNISYAAFLGCSKLKTDNISDSVENIAQRAFEGCMSETFKIPSNVTVLTSGMITDPNLKELTIPESVTSIEANFFYGLKSLEKVYILTKHSLNAKIGLNDMTGGYKFTVYGYENANEWVKEMNNPYINNNMGLGAFMPQSNYINYVPLSSEMIDDKKEIIEDNQTPSTPEKEIDISNSEYLKSQEYLKALQIGTDDAMEEYIYNYESGYMNPNIKTYVNTEEYLLDIYSDETFNLNFKTAYLNENTAMQTYKNKNHYILILPDNALDLNEGYHYLVEGDGTGFKYNALPVGNYTAYVRSDLCNEVGGDLAQFKITVHDLAMDNIDEELAIAINFLKENGAMTGYEDGSFRPNKSMTRAEFAAIICRFTNNDIEFTGENNAFNDVFGDYWGYNYVMNAYQKGLLKGYGGGVFGCDDTLTEEQAITVLCRMLGDTYEDVSYIETNVDEKGGYSEGYISIAGERGIDIEGLQKTIPATRARVAKWLYQLYNIKNNF